MLEDRFLRHPETRIIDAEGDAQPRGAAAAALPADRPAAQALAAALAQSGGGLSFRIGGGAEMPSTGSVPMFETLTGGSSGSPKRIRRTQASWTASFAVNADRFGIGPGTRIAVPGRLVQSLALYGAMEGAHLGAEVHLLDGLRPDRQAAALAARQIEVIYATPTQLRQICRAAHPPVTTLRFALIGGERLDAPTRSIIGAMFPNAALREFYGSAETSFVTLADDATPPGSVGPAYPGVEIRLREGEIWVRSPYLFDGYAGPSGGGRWHDGWLSVGERGRLDHGLLFLTGRDGRMITVAGQNVFPEEIEAFLVSCPGVLRAAVIARPDARRGHVLEAVIEGGQEAAILAACRTRFGPMFAPRRIHRIADWPVLSSGKTDLAALALATR